MILEGKQKEFLLDSSLENESIKSCNTMSCHFFC